MDQHGEKEAENKSQDSAEQRQDDDAAAADGNAEESVGRRAGYKAEESAGLLIKEVVSSEDAASPALFAHPCSLLQLLLSACAGCLGLHGYCGGSVPDYPKSPADAAPDAAAAAADPSEEGEGGGEEANFVYMQEEVVTSVWAVRRAQPPGRPREGSGGNGGVHH